MSFSVVVKIIPVELQAYEQSCSSAIRGKSQASEPSNDFICSEPASAYGFKASEDFFFLDVFSSLDNLMLVIGTEGKKFLCGF